VEGAENRSITTKHFRNFSKDNFHASNDPRPRSAQFTGRALGLELGNYFCQLRSEPQTQNNIKVNNERLEYRNKNSSPSSRQVQVNQEPSYSDEIQSKAPITKASLAIDEKAHGIAQLIG
jgi:hypothetical protein